MSQRKTKTPTTNDVSITPKGKKLVQARLPFKTLASSPKVDRDTLTAESRKRKLSTSDDDGNRSIKVSKVSKENVKESNEVTVLDMVDLVDDDDIVMNDIGPADELSKQAKKSVDGDPEETTTTTTTTPQQLRRSGRKIDSDSPVAAAKVVIKIPTAKKKKPTERPAKVTTKVSTVDEAEDDDDVIPLDSGENSLNSVDAKDGLDGKADNSFVVLDDDSGGIVPDEDKSNQKVVESTDDNNKPAANGDDSNGFVVAVATVSEETDTTAAVEAKSSPVSDDSENESVGADVKSENSSESVEEMDGEKSETKPTQVSTPSSSKMSKRKRQSIDNGFAASPKTPVAKTSENRTLTPKQLQKKLESEQKRLAKEKAKEERDRKIQEAKEERERKVQEAKEERERKAQEAKEERERKLQEEKEQRQKEREQKEEQKRKEREDKEEQRRKEKEERDKKKQAEIDARNEEKRQKEEEKVAKEEAELKKKRKESEAFTKFFAKKSNKSAESCEKMDVDEVEAKLNFMPFRIKPDMRLAPTVRRKLSPSRISKFDAEVLHSADNCTAAKLYIDSLRTGSHVSQKQGKTWPNEDNNDDLIIIDELEGGTPIEETTDRQKYRAKFFKFEENRRPPYYGTWQKKSTLIRPRRPFVTDQKFFDYEIDSDDEWEDEEPGESLHGSDDEKDKESDDDYDIDNEFFVPHGHLSDEELENNGEVDDDNSPDAQKAKLKIMQKAFSDEMKKKTEKIKPRLVGLIWQNRDGSQPAVCPSVIWEMLQMRAMIFNGPVIVMPTDESANKVDVFDDLNESKKNPAMKKRVKMSDENVLDLLRLIHGNTNSGEFLSKEFRAFTAQQNKDNDKFQEYSLVSIRQKIKELADWKQCPEDGPMQNKFCWYVSTEQRKLHHLDDLSIVNEWKYLLTPKTKAKAESKKLKENENKAKVQSEATDEPSSATKTPKSKLGNIAKFTKILSDDDKKKNFSIPLQEPSASENASPKPKPEVKPKADAEAKPVKKRVSLLMSVPRGQEIPAQTKNSLISQYLSSASKSKKAADVDEPICID